MSIANLQINMGYSCIPYMKLNRLTHAAEYIADQMDVSVPPTMPYVGRLAFSEEIPVIPNSRSVNMVHPEVVGNSRRMNLMTSYALTTLIERMNKMGYKVTRDLVTSLDIWKEYHRGYATEVSVALQILRGLGRVNSVFTIQDVKVLTERIEGADYDRTHVMMESLLGGEKRMSSGVGPDMVEAFWEAVQDAVSYKIKSARNIRVNSVRGRALTRSEFSAILDVTNGERAWSVSAVEPTELRCLCSMARDVIDYHLLTMGFYREKK